MNIRTPVSARFARFERARLRTREDIIEAAARVFARHGVAAATMQQIAAEAGYTAASLYSYFTSKQELVGALGRLLHDEFLSLVNEPMPEGLAFPQRLELFVKRNAELVDRRRSVLFDFLATRLSRKSSGTGASEGPPAGSSVKALASWMAKNAPPAVLARYSAVELGELLHGLRFSFLLSWIEAGAPKEELARRTALIVELFLNGVSGGSRRNAG